MFVLLGFAAQVCVISAIAAIVISCISSPQSPVVAEVTVADATLSASTSCCAKSIVSASYTTIIDEPTVSPDDYSAMTVKQLIALCKQRGIKGYSSLRKHELIALLSEF